MDTHGPGCVTELNQKITLPAVTVVIEVSSVSKEGRNMAHAPDGVSHHRLKFVQRVVSHPGKPFQLRRETTQGHHMRLHLVRLQQQAGFGQ